VDGPALYQTRFPLMGGGALVQFVDNRGRGEAERIARSVESEARRIEVKFSRYRERSVVSEINRNAGRTPVAVDDETAMLVRSALDLTRLTGGRFDPTVGALRRVWDFRSGRVPSDEEISAHLPLVNAGAVSTRDRTVFLRRPGMEIDLGGVGKEYAVDRAAALVGSLTQSCLLNFGGDLRALGPHANGRPWEVGIEAVDRLSSASQVIDVYRGGVATSGDSRRYLLKDGRRYGHILDPTTGEPVIEAPRSVTVVADTCTQAGMLATLAMLQGKAAKRFLDAQGVRYWCDR